MTTARRGAFPHVLTLAVGLAVGWGLAGGRPGAIRAGGTDRSDESALTAGATSIHYNEGSKVQVAQDAIYYLDYRLGKLIATVPTMKGRSLGGSKLIETFAERDLAADFKLDLDGGPRPHFLMTAGSVPTGASTAFGDGESPLFVVETATRQLAVYKVHQQTVGIVTRTRIDLAELQSFAAPKGK